MIDRGFGIELESVYGQMVQKTEFNPSWWSDAESVDFKLNDEPVIKSGSSRMNRKARAGVMKPTGSTTADADLQQLTWYFRGYLDNYIHTQGSGLNHIHEFWGGEGKQLQSFRGIAVYDMLKKYIYGMLEDQLKLEVSDSEMTVSADWIYKTEKAGIVNVDGETFARPIPLTREDLFIMFYDVDLSLNNLPLDGISTAFSFEGNNNHNVDSTIGLGSRYPQRRAQAGKRENKLSITTTLTNDTVRSILDAQYGEIGALEPSLCKILQVPLEINISHCEDATQYCKILFPKCTLRVEFDMSGADTIEATISLESLGTGTANLNNNETVTTDMYVKLVNYQRNLEGTDILFNGEGFLYNTSAVTVNEAAGGILVTNISDTDGRVYSANKPFTGTNTADWVAPYTVEGEIISSTGEVRIQLFDSNESYVSRTLEQLGIEDGGKFKIVNDGTTVSYFVNNGLEAVYEVEKEFENPVQIRFYLTGGASFIYRTFVIYNDETTQSTNLNLNSPMRQEIPETVNIHVNVNDGENSIKSANVNINEISSITGSAGGCTLQNVPVGSQTINVNAEGYEDYNETIEVTSEDTDFEITLDEAK